MADDDEDFSYSSSSFAQIRSIARKLAASNSPALTQSSPATGAKRSHDDSDNDSDDLSTIHSLLNSKHGKQNKGKSRKIIKPKTNFDHAADIQVLAHVISAPSRPDSVSELKSADCNVESNNIVDHGLLRDQRRLIERERIRKETFNSILSHTDQLTASAVSTIPVVPVQEVLPSQVTDCSNAQRCSVDPDGELQFASIKARYLDPTGAARTKKLRINLNHLWGTISENLLHGLQKEYPNIRGLSIQFDGSNVDNASTPASDGVESDDLLDIKLK